MPNFVEDERLVTQGFELDFLDTTGIMYIYSFGCYSKQRHLINDPMFSTELLISNKYYASISISFPINNQVCVMDIKLRQTPRANNSS